MTVKFEKPKPKPVPNGTYVRLTDDQLDAIAIICTKEDRNISSTIRVLINEALEARKR